MSQPVVTCHVGDSLADAARLMWEHDVGALPVVADDDTVVGMITDRDISMAAYTQGRPLAAVPVATAMANHVVAAQRHYRAIDVEQLMAQYQVRRLPVVDEHGRAIGMISLGDLAAASVRPGSRITNASMKIPQTLVAISEPRKRQAA